MGVKSQGNLDFFMVRELQTVREIEIVGKCQGILKIPDSRIVTMLIHHHPINVFRADINQMESTRSAFYVEIGVVQL